MINYQDTYIFTQRAHAERRCTCLHYGGHTDQHTSEGADRGVSYRIVTITHRIARPLARLILDVGDEDPLAGEI